jgi:hypothetical protein
VHSANSKSIIIDSKFQHKIFSIELKAADFNLVGRLFFLTQDFLPCKQMI